MCTVYVLCISKKTLQEPKYIVLVSIDQKSKLKYR